MTNPITRNNIAATDSLVSPSATSIDPVPISSKPEMDADLVSITDDLAAEVRKCQANSIGWLIKAGQHFRSCRSQLPHGNWSTIFASGRLPVGLRCAQMLARVAGNKALCNASLLQRLPHNLAVLEALAALDPCLIEKGVQDRTIHRSLTVKAARALVRKHRSDQPVAVSQPSTPTRL